MKIIVDEKELKTPNIIVYVYTEWMLFHKKYIKMIQIIEKEFGITIYALNAEHFKEHCIEHKIDVVPLICLYYDGKPVKQVEGLILLPALKKTVRSFLTNIL